MKPEKKAARRIYQCFDGEITVGEKMASQIIAEEMQSERDMADKMLEALNSAEEFMDSIPIASGGTYDEICRVIKEAEKAKKERKHEQKEGREEAKGYTLRQ